MVDFNRAELDWIKELVEDEIYRRKDDGTYDYYNGDKEVFESILKKIEESR
mgnify:CR=1 FL=1